MGGIIADNVGRSSGLIKGAAAPAGIVLVDTAYCSSSPGTSGQLTWTALGTGSVNQEGTKTAEYGGVLAGATEAISWGSVISFPSTGVYSIWGDITCGGSTSNWLKVWIDDGNGYGYQGFYYVQAHMGYGGTGGRSFNFGYKVSNTSEDRLRFYSSGSTVSNGNQYGSMMTIAKFE